MSGSIKILMPSPQGFIGNAERERVSEAKILNKAINFKLSFPDECNGQVEFKAKNL